MYSGIEWRSSVRWAAARSAVCCGVVFLASATVAHAQVDSSSAESLYDEGLRLYDAKQYDLACPKFEASLKLNPENLDYRGELAFCYVHADKLASAWTEFRDVRARAARMGLEAPVKIADEQIAALGPRLARLTIHLASKAVTVKKDGVLVPPDAFDVALAVDAGRLVLSADAPGRTSWTQDVGIKNGEQKTLEVPDLDVAAVIEPEQPAPEIAPTIGTRGKGAIVTASVGVVAVAVGLGFGAKARSDWNAAHANGHCDDRQHCDDVGFAGVNDAYSAATVATVVTGIGLVTVATGAYLWFTGHAHEETPRTALGPTVRAGQVGLVIQGWF